jgi:sn-glycerol 3-phosphate transport system permease protein
MALPPSAASPRAAIAAGRRRVNVAGHAVMILLAIVCVFPVYWMVVTSVRPTSEMLQLALWPSTLTWEHYRFMWQSIPMDRMLATTVWMSVLVTGTQLLTALLAAYGFARWTFRGGRLLFALFALTWLVPFQVTMIPNYVLLADLRWLDTLWALVVPQVASAFAVLLLYQSVKAFPRDLFDAARIDGANSWATLWRVVVPNLRAQLAMLGILLFISAWNEYFWPLLVTRDIERSVVQIGLQMFLTSEGDLWGPLMAGATVASLPILALYVVLQRQVIESFMKSGLR